MPDDLKGEKTFENFKNLGDLGKSFMDTKRAFTSKVSDTLAKALDPKHQDDPIVQEVRQTLGMPKAIDEYQAPDLPEGQARNDALDQWFKDTAFKAGISTQQFNDLYGGFMAMQQQNLEQFKEKTAELFGGKLDDATATANKALATLPEDVQEMAKNYVGFDPVITRLLQIMGENQREDNSPPSGPGGGGGTSNLDQLEKELKELTDSPIYKTAGGYEKAIELRQKIKQLKIKNG